MASRTHFQILGHGLGLKGQDLGLGLEALVPRKLPCPRLEDSTIFLAVEILLQNAKNLAENLRRPFLFFSIGALAEAGGLGPSPIEILPMTKM